MSRKATSIPKTSDPVSRRRDPSDGDGRGWFEVQGPRPLNVDGALHRRGRPFRASKAVAASYGDALKPTAGKDSEIPAPEAAPSPNTQTQTQSKSKTGAKG